jgi:hypothetical protein
MTARTGMTNLITQLRALTSAGTADYTLGSETYWSDNHLQDRLDMARVDLNRVPLTPDPEYGGGTPYYHDYYAPVGYLEEADSGTAVWSVEDSDGDEAGTANYTVDYLRGLIRFSADQSGTAYYLRARSYNLNRAAALVWRVKAAHYAERFDISTDNHSLSRSQLVKQCIDMARAYETQAGMIFSKMVRRDLA